MCSTRDFLFEALIDDASNPSSGHEPEKTAPHAAQLS
jgi:hypothetical protein